MVKGLRWLTNGSSSTGSADGRLASVPAPAFRLRGVTILVRRWTRCARRSSRRSCACGARARRSWPTSSAESPQISGSFPNGGCSALHRVTVQGAARIGPRRPRLLGGAIRLEPATMQFTGLIGTGPAGRPTLTPFYRSSGGRSAAPFSPRSAVDGWADPDPDEAVVTGDHLPPRSRRTEDEVARAQRDLVAVHAQCSAAADHRVDLFLVVAGVIVLRAFLSRAELELVHAKAADTERVAEPSEDSVRGLDVRHVDDRCHGTLLRRFGRVYYAPPVATFRFGAYGVCGHAPQRPRCRARARSASRMRNDAYRPRRWW